MPYRKQPRHPRLRLRQLEITEHQTQGIAGQQARDLGILRFSDGVDAVLSHEHLSGDFRPVREEYKKNSIDYGVYNMGPYPLPGGRIVFLRRTAATLAAEARSRHDAEVVYIDGRKGLQLPKEFRDAMHATVVPHDPPPITATVIINSVSVNPFCPGRSFRRLDFAEIFNGFTR